MFTGISWSTYGTGLLLLTLVWYAYVFIRYYRPEIQNFIGNHNKKKGEPESAVTTNFFIAEKAEITPAGTFNEWQDTTPDDVEILMRRIKDTVAQTCHVPFDKKEFSRHLSVVLTLFSSLKDSPYRGAINEFIEVTCKERSLFFTQEDAELLW